MSPTTPAPAEAPARQPAEAPLVPGRPSVRLVAGVTIVVLAIAAIGYWRTGVPDYAEQAAAAEREAAQQSGPSAHDSQQVAAMVEKLKERLKAQPDDAEGWGMLGRTQMILGQPQEAQVAYRKALALRPDDPRLLADLAELIGITHGHSLTGEPTQLLDRALAIDPRAPKALALSGAAAFDRKEFALAVKHWEALLAASPGDAGFVAQVREGIAEARRLGGLPEGAGAPPAMAAAEAPKAGTTSAEAPAAAAAGGSVSGTVTIAAAIKGKAAPDDTVFVYARAAEGPRMPLAMLRKQVKDLPIAFSLDDTMAMQPQMRLSAFPKVVVVARVSRSGQATPQAGDLTGQSAPVAIGAQGLKVEIADVTP